MEDMFKVGVITTAHGVHGEFKVFPTTDDVYRFKDLKEIYLNDGNNMLLKKITGVKFFKQLAILKLEGIDTPEEVLKYRQKELYVDRAHAVKLQKDEYFIADLIGLQVVDEEDHVIGVLDDVLSTGANDVYIVKSSQIEKEIMIPAIKDCIKCVDIENGKMYVHLLEGLMDL